MVGQVVSDRGGARQFDHGADLVSDFHALLFLYVSTDLLGHGAAVLHLFDGADTGDHNLRFGVNTLLLQVTSRFHDGANLHLIDLGEDDAVEDESERLTAYCEARATEVVDEISIESPENASVLEVCIFETSLSGETRAGVTALLRRLKKQFVRAC